MSPLRVHACAALIFAIGVLTSGCDIAILVALGAFQNGQTTVAFNAQGQAVAQCSFNVQPGVAPHFDCSYLVNGQDVASTIANGNLSQSINSSALLIDPVILEVPTGASNFSGTFSSSGVPSQPLIITVVAGNVPVDFSTQLVPEPGTKLVIVDFPNPTPPLNNRTYDFSLSFQLPGNAFPVPIKALFAGKVRVNNQTFYLPILPCETNFATIPTVFILQSSSFQPVNLPSPSTIRGCQNKVYDFGGAATVQAVPTMSGWGLLTAGVVLVLSAVIALHRHRRRSLPS